VERQTTTPTSDTEDGVGEAAEMSAALILEIDQHSGVHDPVAEVDDPPSSHHGEGEDHNHEHHRHLGGRAGSAPVGGFVDVAVARLIGQSQVVKDDRPGKVDHSVEGEVDSMQQ